VPPYATIAAMMMTILGLIGAAIGLWLTHWFVRIIRGEE
jgi:hypothetical protein